MKKQHIILAILLIAFGAFYRVFRLDVMEGLPNFSPVMALAFCGALVLPGWLAFGAPIAALFASDLILNAHYGLPLVSAVMAPVYACYVFAAIMGLLLRGRGLGTILGATVVNALVFYVVTNFLAWIGNPAYPQTMAGLVQSLTVGLPGYAPTWMFFRNSLFSDLLFTGLFLGVFHLARKRSAEPSLCRQESSS